LAMVLSAPVPDVQCYIIKVVNEGVGALNGLAEWTSGLPYATVSFSVLKPVEIGMFYLMLGLWVMYVRSKRRKWLIGGLASLACLLGIHLFLLLSFR